MRKWCYKTRMTVRTIFSIYLIIALTLAGISSTAYADDSSNNSAPDSYVFALKEDENTQKMMEDLKNKYPQLKIDPINEINTMTIASEDYELLDQAQKYVNSKYKNMIEGGNKEQTITLKEFGTPSVMSQPLSQLTKSNHVQSRMLLPSNEGSNIYDAWRWDIKKVTSDGASYLIEKGNHNVKIGIVDSGVDVHHPDLKDNIVSPGKSLVPGVSSITDEIGHGTMVAGSIAANGNIKGISPEVGIVPYKVFQGYSADSSWIIKAIIEAANDDMDIINLSLGTYKSMKNKEDRATYLSYKRAIFYANKKGSLLVASSGTDGYDITNPMKLAEQMGLKNDLQLHMPGGLSNVVTVSATNLNDQLAYYSNYGTNVDIAAPAGDYGPNFADHQKVELEYMTLTTYPTTLPQSEIGKYLGFAPGYEFMIGTSLAAPKVSATAALIIVEYQEKYGKKPSPNTVKRYLYGGTVKGNETKRKLGNGIVNAKNSLDLVIKR
ncbi:S8 family peptidase [Bacillus sp. FJAT-52991]|uniref:S8 family serine peptidase n=1 Tax=Bacillus kandeliae TaxID=3129297 RepID=A0ABZ2NBP7_9BACI